MDRQETIKGVTYVIGRLDVFEQFHIARRLGPMLSELLQAFKSAAGLFMGEAASKDEIIMAILEIATGPLANALAKMSNADADYILHGCLAVCQRQQATGYAKVYVRGGGMMFQDIQLDTLLALVFFVIQENLGGFFPTGQPTSGTQK
jgi:hypothetical protein